MNYQDRIKSVQDYLKEHSLDALLVLTKLNRQYVSGFTGSAGMVLVGRKKAELFVDDRYTIRAKRESPLKVRSMGEIGEIREISKIGIEDDVTLAEFERLKKLKKTGWVVTHEVVRGLRAVKTVEEIRYITKAQKILDETFEHLKKFIKKNYPSPQSSPARGEEGRGGRALTESDIALELERFAKKLGADGLAFESIVAFGGNAAAPHHLSGKQKIKKNNFLLMDFGVLVKGYHSDFTRTLFIGKPNKKQELVYNTVLEAQLRGIGEIRGTGTRARDVDQAARGYIESQGFGKYFTHNTGHGVGLQIHELPNFSPKSPDILAPEMIVTVEPGIYIENWGGVRIEDMVLVTKKGPRRLSKTSRELKDMIIS